VLELEPDELDEYPWREDIITFSTMDVPLFAATVNDLSFLLGAVLAVRGAVSRS